MRNSDAGIRQRRLGKARPSERTKRKLMPSENRGSEPHTALTISTSPILSGSRRTSAVTPPPGASGPKGVGAMVQWDRKSGGKGRRASDRDAHGGSRTIKKKKQ